MIQKRKLVRFCWKGGIVFYIEQCNCQSNEKSNVAKVLWIRSLQNIQRTNSTCKTLKNLKKWGIKFGYILYKFCIHPLYTSCTTFVYKMYTWLPCGGIPWANFDQGLKEVRINFNMLPKIRELAKDDQEGISSKKDICM